MTEQVLPIFEAHARGTKPSAQRVLQVMHANLPETQVFPGPAPGAVEHSGNRLALNQPFQLGDVVSKRAFVLVLANELCRRYFERSPRPNAIHLRFAGLLDKPCEEQFGLFEASCFSALANSPPADALVDIIILIGSLDGA
jgi:hypothetical protein